MAPQRARTCFLGFVFLAVATLPALWAAAEQRPNDQESAETSTTLGSSAAKGAPASESGASYFSEAAKLTKAGSYATNRLGLYDALARGTVELLEAKADGVDILATERHGQHGTNLRRDIGRHRIQLVRREVGLCARFEHSLLVLEVRETRVLAKSVR